MKSDQKQSINQYHASVSEQKWKYAPIWHDSDNMFDYISISIFSLDSYLCTQCLCCSTTFLHNVSVLYIY